MSRKPEKSVHIDKIRLIAAATSKFELRVGELRHMVRCSECLHLFRDSRDPFRPAQRKAAKLAA
jgi:hypothetical protein